MNRSLTASSLLAVVLLGLGQEATTAERPDGPRAQSTIPIATIERWVEELDSDQFATRESAMHSLITAGSQVIPPVVSAMKDDRRERIARGVYVLEQLAQGGDSSTEQAARAALKSLASGTKSVAARRARASLDKLDRLRQHRAASALSWLGANIQFLPDPFEGHSRQVPYLIQIDERWTGTDEHLIHLRSLVDVQRVVLRGPQVHDAWLESIRSLPKVVSVSIVHANITDQGLAHLGSMPRLERLNVWYTPITDGALQYLQQLTSAQSLLLYGTNIRRERADQLKAKLARTSIDIRNGAFLGVGAFPNLQKCVISTVRSGSAAQRAGLQVRDVITHYDGKKVRDFESLRELIGSNRPGDKVEVRIERNSQPLTKQIRLGEWDLRQVPN